MMVESGLSASECDCGKLHLELAGIGWSRTGSYWVREPERWSLVADDLGLTKKACQSE